MPLLSLRASTPFFSPSSPFPKRRSNLTRFFSVKMSTAASETVEHIVLFKVKDSVEPSRIQSMLSSLNALVSLDSVLHLSAGPIHRLKSSPIPFTHLLHSRYSSKENLKAYALHPSHVSAVKDCVLPVCEDVMAVDWIARDLQGPMVPPAGSGIRLTFLKLKENLGAEAKDEIIEVIGGVKAKLGEMEQLTVGENFSPERAKGYSIASLALFGGTREMDSVDAKAELVNSDKDKVREHLESVIVLDYVVPSSQSAASL
ncbi:Stress-response A/B barrel domain-containing protein UP3 [Linum grandiflorum]